MIWSTHFKTFRLLHVDLLFKCAIKIGMGDVNGAKFQVLQGSQSKDNANGGVSDSGSKGLLVIKARTLRIALGHQSGLVAVQGAISIVFDLEEPSGTNSMLPRGQFDDLPSAIETVSLHFFLTSCVPQICIRAVLRVSIGCWLSCGCCTGLQDVQGVIRVILFLIRRRDHWCGLPRLSVLGKHHRDLTQGESDSKHSTERALM